MTQQRLLSLLTEFCDRNTHPSDASGIQVIFSEEIKRTCASADVSGFELLMDDILIDGGKRRSTASIMAAFPVLYMILGNKDNRRLAEWPA